MRWRRRQREGGGTAEQEGCIGRAAAQREGSSGDCFIFLTGISLPTLIQHMAEPLAKAFRTSGDEGAGVV